MLKTIIVKGFRALRYAEVPLTPMQVLVGPNACGKSTFFDVLLFVRDILNHGIEAAVLGDERLRVPSRAADPRDLTWQRQGEQIEIVLRAALPEALRGPGAASGAAGEDDANGPRGYDECRYEIAIRDDEGPKIISETFYLVQSSANGETTNGSDGGEGRRQGSLFPAPPAPPETVVLGPRRQAPAGWRTVVRKQGETGNDYFRSETTKWNIQYNIGPLKSSLAGLPEDLEKFPAARWFRNLMQEGVQRLMLNAEMLRKPAKRTDPRVFLPDGSNLPWVVHRLESENPKAHGRWVQHVQTALPDLEDITTVERPEDRARYIVVKYRGGLEAPAWTVSDGTLRLLALTLLAYVPAEGGILLVEEPENGMHPQAVETVFQSLSSVYDQQVFCASHSPVLLSLARTSQLLCFAKASNGAVDIVRGEDHPRLKAWRGAVNLGDLLATGVLG